MEEGGYQEEDGRRGGRETWGNKGCTIEVCGRNKECVGVADGGVGLT